MTSSTPLSAKTSRTMQSVKLQKLFNLILSKKGFWKLQLWMILCFNDRPYCIFDICNYFNRWDSSGHGTTWFLKNGNGSRHPLPATKTSKWECCGISNISALIKNKGWVNFGMSAGKCKKKHMESNTVKYLQYVKKCM